MPQGRLRLRESGAAPKRQQVAKYLPENITLLIHA
jgi:hypothetical protein